MNFQLLILQELLIIHLYCFLKKNILIGMHILFIFRENEEDH